MDDPKVWKASARASQLAQARTWSDLIRISRSNPAGLVAGVRLEGEEHFRKAVEFGRGVLAVSAHFEGLYRVVFRLRAEGHPIFAPIEPLSDRTLNDLTFSLLSEKGVEFAPLGISTGKTMISRLRKGGVVMWADRDIQGTGEVMPFRSASQDADWSSGSCPKN